MRNISITLVLILFLACNFNQPKSNESNQPVKLESGIDSVKIAMIKLNTPADFLRLLDTIDPGDLTSLDIAGILLKNCTADTLTRDSMFLVFDDFINHLSGNYLENNEMANTQLSNAPSPQTVRLLEQMFGAHGLLLGYLDGSYYLEPQIRFLLQNYGSGLSPAYREFLSIESWEQERLFALGGKILIPGDSVISRIIRWDQFMESNHGFVSIRSAQDKYAQYLGAFLAGMEDSKVFDPETNILKDSSRISFESLVGKYPGTKSSVVVQEYLDLLKSSDFVYSEKVDSFLLKKVYGLETEEEQKVSSEIK